jgi:hypothetical protein
VPGGTMIRNLRVLTIAGLLSGLVACSSTSTKLSMKWKEPTLQGETSFKKVVTVGVSPDVRWREIVEDELSILARNAVPAYSIIPEADVRNVELAKRILKSGGYDGVIVLRLVGVDEESTLVSGAPAAWGSYYGSMWSYWGYAWPTVYNPGYLRTDRYQVVEILIYRVADEKLLWAGRTRSLEPSSVRAMTGEIVKEVREELLRQKLIAPPAK